MIPIINAQLGSVAAVVARNAASAGETPDGGEQASRRNDEPRRARPRAAPKSERCLASILSEIFVAMFVLSSAAQA